MNHKWHWWGFNIWKQPLTTRVVSQHLYLCTILINEISLVKSVDTSILRFFIVPPISLNRLYNIWLCKTFSNTLIRINSYVMLCYVMWNLFTVGSLQFPNDNTIASLKANQISPSLSQTLHLNRICSNNFFWEFVPLMPSKTVGYMNRDTVRNLWGITYIKSIKMPRNELLVIRNLISSEKKNSLLIYHPTF